MRLLPVLALLHALLLAAPAFATPLMLSHQGFLLGANDAPMDGPLSLGFRLYTQPTGGTPVWSETVSVNVQRGYYSALLGQTTPLAGVPLAGSYLAVVIGAVELTPRHTIATAPYAELANRIDGGTVTDATITGGTLTGAVVDATEVKIGGQTVIDSTGRLMGAARPSPGKGLELDASNNLAVRTCAAGQQLRWNDSTWECFDPATTFLTISAAQAGYVPLTGGSITGSLSLTKSIQPGNDTSECTSALAGAIRWNGTALQVCNGSEPWVNVGTGGGGGGGGDPYFASVAFLSHMENGVTPTVGSVLTNNNAVAFSSAKAAYGLYSAQFNGSNSYLSGPVAFGLGALEDFTIEAAFYFTAFPSSGYGAGIVTIQNSSNYNHRIMIRVNPSGGATSTMNCYVVVAGQTFSSGSGLSAGTVTLNTWHQMAFVRRNGNFYIFLDGALQASVTTQTTFGMAGGFDTINIGRNQDGAAPYMTGYVDEVRVTKGVGRYVANYSTAEFKDF